MRRSCFIFEMINLNIFANKNLREMSRIHYQAPSSPVSSGGACDLASQRGIRVGWR